MPHPLTEGPTMPNRQPAIPEPPPEGGDSTDNDWSDPPVIDLSEHGLPDDEAGLVQVGTRLSRGVPFMSGRQDIPLILHKEDRKGAWCWLDRPLVTLSRLAPIDSADSRGEAPNLPERATKKNHTEGHVEDQIEDLKARGMHVCLPPLLQEADPWKVNPLNPEGRLAYPAVPGALAHASAHLRHTRIDTALLDAQAWPVIAAATMLEEIRCEAAYLTHRPWDAPYLSAAALLSSLPESTDPQWRAAHLALTILGRAPTGAFKAHKVETVRAMVNSALTPQQLDRLETIWTRALRLPDGDTRGLIALATTWARAIPTANEHLILTDPCAERTHYLTPPPPPLRQGGAGLEGQQSGALGGGEQLTGDWEEWIDFSASEGGAQYNQHVGGMDLVTGISGGEMGGTSPSVRERPDRSGIPFSSFFPSTRTFNRSEDYARKQFYLEQQKQLLKSSFERLRGTYDPKSQTHVMKYDISGAHKIKSYKKQIHLHGCKPTPNPLDLRVEWDDPKAAPYKKTFDRGASGPKKYIDWNWRNYPLMETTPEECKNSEKALDLAYQGIHREVFRRDDEGNFAHSLAIDSRNPTPGEERMRHDLEAGLQRIVFQERDKTKTSFDRPPGRMSGRDMMQRQAQIHLGRAPIARPWQRQVRTRVPTPTISALILAATDPGMSKPTAAIIWALSHAIHAAGGRSAAFTTGIIPGPITLAEETPPQKVPEFPDWITMKGRVEVGIRIGVEHLNLNDSRGTKILFIINEETSESSHKWMTYKYMTQLIEQGVRIILLTFRPPIIIGEYLIYPSPYLPKEVTVINIDTQKDVAKLLVDAIEGVPTPDPMRGPIGHYTGGSLIPAEWVWLRPR